MYCYAGNNPVRYTDPDGREIDATFEVTEYEKTTDGWKAKGNLILTDLDTNKTITIGAYSGGIKQAPDGVSLPIPLGEYDILEQKANQDFFRLEAKDSCYGNDKVDGIITPQDLLRLHYEGITYGCLSAEAKFGEEFDNIKNFIRGTSTSEVSVDYKGRNPFKSKETVIKYGTLKVIQSKEIIYRDKYADPCYKQKYVHQRMK